MSVENKFLFLGKTFISIFLIINLVNLFPMRLRDVFYYTKNINIFLDTTTLLLLGLSIPKFLVLRKISIKRNLLIKKAKEDDEIYCEIGKLEEKQNLNSTICKYLAIFFLIITIIQPINLIFVMNRSDFFISNVINSRNQVLDYRKSQILEDQQFNSENLTEDLIKKREEQGKFLINQLEESHKIEIDNLIRNNNSNKFEQIKFIIRNILMSLIWSFAFLKLSNLNIN